MFKKLKMESFQRQTAHKLRINDILLGKPIMDGEKFSCLDLGNKKIVRVNVIGNIIEKYSNSGDKKYSFITLDDGSEQIKLKSFGDDSEKIDQFFQGQTIIVIGTLRFFNNEIYIAPEITKIMPSEYLLIRKLELEKSRKNLNVDKEQVFAIKDKILDLIKNSEDSGGIDIDKIILEIRESPTEIINQEVKKLLEDGIIFEPRPGRLRYLG